MFNIKNKNFLLTGCTGHLGYHIAKGLLNNGAGLIATIKDRRKKSKINDLKKSGAILFEVDLRDTKKIDNFFKKIHDQKIHGVINNAVWVDRKTAFSINHDLGEEDIDSIRLGIEGSFNIPFYIMQKSIPFLKRTGGSIVNIASIYGLVSPDFRIYKDFPEYKSTPTYGAGKAALIQLTRYASCKLAAYKIRVNSISPGPFPSLKVQKDKRFIEELKFRSPIGRIGKPSEIVGPVIFLLSDASSYITGENLVVDGGMTSW